MGSNHYMTTLRNKINSELTSLDYSSLHVDYDGFEAIVYQGEELTIYFVIELDTYTPCLIIHTYTYDKNLVEQSIISTQLMTLELVKCFIVDIIKKHQQTF